jgi:alkanesulfonate monooxygenase SsuD/methylene tetrahydromethanopterin reductase-like flavin-dependent oxidoreductase (luciferase family)
MDVYYLSLGDHLPDPLTGERAAQGERLREIVEAAVYAEELGFTGVGVGEHHFHDYIVSAPEILLAAIAARTTRLRLGTAVTLLAHADPVRVAEELSMLDALSTGRAQLCVARGVSARTWAAFGSEDEDDVRARLETNLRLLLQLLSESEVRWSGATRAPLDAVTIQPRPWSAPEPRIWLGAGFSPRSADLAAELRLPLLLPSTLHPPAVHLPVVARYREALARRGEAHLARVGLPVHLHVAATDSRAQAEWTPYLQAYARFAAELRGGGSTHTQAMGELLEGAAVCGSPETAAARLNRLIAEFGLDALYVLMDVGGMPAEDVHACMRLFAEEVMPRLEPPAPRP